MMKNRSTLPLMAPKRPMAPPPPSPRPPRPQQCVAMTARATIVPLPLPRRLPLARPAEAPVTLPVTPPVTPPVPNNSELSAAEHADGIARMSDELRATVEKKDAPLLELIQTIDRDVAKLVALAIRRDDPLERRMSIHDMGVEVKTSLALLAFDTARAGAVYRESVRSLSNGLAQAVEQITSDDALTQSLMERLEERENEVKLLRAQLEMKEVKQSKERTDSSCSSRDSMTDTSDATDANVVSDESASFTEDAADDKRQSSVSAVLDASVDVGCGVDGAVAVTADAAADPVAVRQADQVSPASIDAQIEYYLSFLHDEDDAWVLPATQEPDVCSSTKTSKISSIAPVATQSEPVSNARASRILQPKIQVPSSLKQRVPGQALGAVTAASSSPSGMSCSRRSILPPGWAVAHIVRSKAAHQTTRSRSKTAPTSRSPVCGKQTNAMVVPAVASASKNPIRKSRRKVAAPTQMENRQPWR